MDGWQLPLAPEQAFSLALSQERVGVAQFATPSEVMTMNFATVVLGAKGEPGPAGVQQTGHFFTHAITPAEITAKQLLLPTVPQSEVIVSFVSGTTQRSNVDFQVTGLVMSWAGLSMELLLEAGDCISISYF